MPSDSLESLGELVRLIDEGSQEYRRLANRISDSIQLIESKIAGIQGRLEATVSGSHDGEKYLFLKLSRDNRVVNFWYGISESDFPGELPSHWRTLSGGPLGVKITGLQLIPQLLLALREEQDQEVNRLRQVTDSLDALLKGLDADSMEGA